MAAHIAANETPPPGETTDEDMGRLIQAQLLINDLVSGADAEAPEDAGVAEVLRAFSMAQRPDVFSHMARIFELYVERLPVACRDLKSQVKASLEVDFLEILVFLFTLYSHFLAALDPDDGEVGGLPRPNWSRGVVDFSALRPDHPSEAAMQRVFDLYSGSWTHLRKELTDLGAGNASILPFLRRPLIRLNDTNAWCFDPGLVLMAGTNGLFWLAVENVKGIDLFGKLGDVFEEYLHDFLNRLIPVRVRHGDDEGQGLPDCYWVEDGVLLAIEAKASVMRDDVMGRGPTSNSGGTGKEDHQGKPADGRHRPSPRTGSKLRQTDSPCRSRDCRPRHLLREPRPGGPPQRSRRKAKGRYDD
ncbi:MAG: hypothetical protein GXP47_00720 [Acidobacteria bacterium]|nr:hypothetical protein [Acidobacteriota bacterium]